MNMPPPPLLFTPLVTIIATMRFHTGNVGDYNDTFAYNIASIFGKSIPYYESLKTT